MVLTIQNKKHQTLKNSSSERAQDETQVVAHLPSNCEALISKTPVQKKRKKTEQKLNWSILSSLSFSCCSL
jgi:hypothetical protein